MLSNCFILYRMKSDEQFDASLVISDVSMIYISHYNNIIIYVCYLTLRSTKFRKFLFWFKGGLYANITHQFFLDIVNSRQILLLCFPSKVYNLFAIILSFIYTSFLLLFLLLSLSRDGN